MKGMFPEYGPLSTEEYKEAWDSAVFIFDTNVLLNLYRYQSSTRDELLGILEKIQERIWIPYQVALEFQRNRLTVIAEQRRRFSDVASAVEKVCVNLTKELDKFQLQKRYSPIDPAPLISGFETLAKTFTERIDELMNSQQSVMEPDTILARIESLFDGKVGAPVKDQPTLDEIYKRADGRYKHQIPPGFEDNGKDKDEPDEYLYGGLTYKRKFGDFMIWEEILQHAKGENIKSVIFVTDDAKEDWWRKISSDGPKTIGPRPELINEARVKAGVELFLMYNPESFLKFASKFLQTSVSAVALNEVREVSNFEEPLRALKEFKKQSARAEEAVFRWLKSVYEEVETNDGFPDFVVYLDGRMHGFEVKLSLVHGASIRSMVDHLLRNLLTIEHSGLDDLTVVFVVNDLASVDEMIRAIAKSEAGKIQKRIDLLVGILLESETKAIEFVPFEKFEFGRR